VPAAAELKLRGYGALRARARRDGRMCCVPAAAELKLRGYEMSVGSRSRKPRTEN
jgi:hypothetical protein